MDITKNLNNLMQEAQKMQQRMQDTQLELAKIQVIGESGGGKVKVYMNGKHEATEIYIDPGLVKQDLAVIQELIVAAINGAVQKVEDASRKKINELTAGINLKDLPLNIDNK